MRPFVLVLLASGLPIFAGCATTAEPNPTSPPSASAATAGSDPALLANSASLLADLLGDEKNLDKILLIKGHGDGDFGLLVKAIAHAAGEGEANLTRLSAFVPGIDPKVLNLPPGEVAARKAIGKSKEADLLLSTDDTFEFNLLLTQAQALGYGSHLAGIVAANAPNRDWANQFKALEAVLGRLLKQVTVQLRSRPAK